MTLYVAIPVKVQEDASLETNILPHLEEDRTVVGVSTVSENIDVLPELPLPLQDPSSPPPADVEEVVSILPLPLLDPSLLPPTDVEEVLPVLPLPLLDPSSPPPADVEDVLPVLPLPLLDPPSPPSADVEDVFPVLPLPLLDPPSPPPAGTVEVTTGMPENDSLSVRTTDQREGQIPVPLWYPEVLTKSEGSMGTAGGTAGINIKTGALESDISSRSSVHSTSRQRAGTIPTPRPALRIPKRDKKLVETPGDTTSMKARIGTRETSVSSVRSARQDAG
jgi:hypothetical protein